MPIILLGKLQTEIRRDSGYIKQIINGVSIGFNGVSQPVHIETGFIVKNAIANWARLRELDIGIIYNFGEAPDDPPELTVSYYDDGTTGFKIEYNANLDQYPNGYILTADWLALG